MCVYAFVPSLLETGSFWLCSALFNDGVSDRGEGVITAGFADPAFLQGTERQQTVSDYGMSTIRWDVRRNGKRKLTGRAEPGSPGLRVSAGLVLSI